MSETINQPSPLKKTNIDPPTLGAAKAAGNEPDPNIPRKLTTAEINDILSVIPKLKGASMETEKYNRESMLKTLKEQLIEIVVTPLAIEDMKDEVLRQFNESLIAPGTVVGVTAAEALGQQITQGALNSFHQSGSAKNVTFGVSRIRELINASENIKTTSCSIFFKDQNKSVDDIIINQRPKLTEINVGDLVKGSPDVDPIALVEDPWWYGPFRTLIRNDFMSNSVVRMELDVNMMYAYKITMKDVADAIENGRSAVVCVYSPMRLGQFHIYPVEKDIAKPIAGKGCEGIVDKGNASMIFLWNCVIPALDTIKISGTTGIKQLYPVEAPVLQIIKEERRVPGKPGMWYLILNPVRMMITGIQKEKLISLAVICDIDIVDPKVGKEYIVVTVRGDESPLERMNRIIEDDKKAEEEYEKRMRNEGALIIRRTPTDVMTASNLVYADTDGSLFKSSESTLRTLLANPTVDSRRTFCNNVHEIKAVLGIEAARTFLIREFSYVIGNEGGYINPRHIVILVDFMVSLGEVYGITFSGISRQPIGALEKASFQNAMPTFAEASAYGEVKEVKGTSASIYVGKKAEIGTGFSETYMDKTKFKKIVDEIDENPDMVLDLGTFQDAIGNLDITTGADFMVMEGAEEEMFAGDVPMIPPTALGDISTAPPAILTQKGPTRAPELDQAAGKLNQAPCILPPKPYVPMVETIPVNTQVTPVPTTPAPVLGLPTGITDAIQPFAPEIPLPATAPIPTTPVPATTTPVTKGKVTFDLDTFLQ